LAATGPVTVVGNTVTLMGAGSVSINATQAGNSSFVAAAPVVRNFTVAAASQTIAFATISNRTLGEAPFLLAPTASSGLPVTLVVTSGPAVILGRTVTLTGAGSVTITASQPGDGNYSAATPVARTFTVSADTTAPSAPTSLASSELTASAVRLSWVASTDNVGVTAYEISGFGSTRIVAATTVKLKLTPATAYTLSVKAKDAAGNLSSATTVNVTTPSEGANADPDNDGVPTRVEDLFGTNSGTAGADGTSLDLRVQKPNP
jgi:chitodextrinase